MLIDYHMHLEHDTYFHPMRLSEDILARYVEQAQNRGVAEIGISEHCYRFAEFDPVVKPISEGSGALPEVQQFLSGCFIDHLDQYVDFLLRMKKKGYPVKLGLEVDYVPGEESTIAQALSDYPWDYLLGSVHFLGKWAIDASATLGWPERNVDIAYKEYFAVWEQACASGLFNSMAHPDLLKKFGHRPAQVPTQLYESAAQAAARAGVAIEVSSAGLRKPVGEIYPSMDFLQAFYHAGVPITLGSDAHTADDVGLGLNQAAAWASQAGYTSIVRFSERQPRPEPLG